MREVYEKGLLHSYVTGLTDAVLGAAGVEIVPLYCVMKIYLCGSVLLQELAESAGVVVMAVGDYNVVYSIWGAYTLQLLHIVHKLAACPGIYKVILPLQGEIYREAVLIGKLQASLWRQVVYKDMQFHSGYLNLLVLKCFLMNVRRYINPKIVNTNPTAYAVE